MKKLFIFLMIFCLMVVSVAAVDYRIEAEEFASGYGTNFNEKWCKYNFNSYPNGCNVLNADGAATKGDGFGLVKIVNNPLTYTTTVNQGSYSLVIYYKDDTTTLDPKISVITEEGQTDFVNPSGKTSGFEEYTFETGLQLSGEVNIILTVADDSTGGYDSNLAIIDYVELRQQSTLPEFGLMGLAVAVLVVIVAMTLHNKRK